MLSPMAWTTCLILTSSALLSCHASAFVHPASNNSKRLTQPYYPPNADCIEYTVPVPVEADVLPFNFTKWSTDDEFTNFLALATTRSSAGYPPVFDANPVREKATYQIAASFCTPKVKNGKEKTIILATHGIGPGRQHWNSAYRPEEYNFVQWAISKGYSVWFYDRLGVGGSEKISGYKNQISISIAVLQSLTKIVRGGQCNGAIGKPSKLALMGFSYGSYTTHGAIAEQPDIADAVILTAIGFNTSGLNANGLLRSFGMRVANLQDPEKFGDLDTGYVTWVDKYAQILNYFKYPFYDNPTANYTEQVKNPFAIAEFLTFLSGPTDASNYTKPILAITGETDYIVCDGLCTGIYEQPLRTYYRNAKVTTHIHPGASHNINFHRNATGAYGVITDFLSSNGL